MPSCEQSSPFDFYPAAKVYSICNYYTAGFSALWKIFSGFFHPVEKSFPPCGKLADLTGNIHHRVHRDSQRLFPLCPSVRSVVKVFCVLPPVT